MARGAGSAGSSLAALFFVASGAALGASPAALQALRAGIDLYDAKSYSEAARVLAGVGDKCGELCDYAAFYHGASLSAGGQPSAAGDALAAFDESHAASPLLPDAIRSRAESLLRSGRAEEAQDVLRKRSSHLPEALRLWLQARVAQASADTAAATRNWRALYAAHPTSNFSSDAVSALASLGLRPSAADRKKRADALFAARRFADSLLLYRELARSSRAGHAAVRVGAALYETGQTANAVRWLSGLQPEGSQAVAERLYYLAQCARRAGNLEAASAHLGHLERRHRSSPWFEEALWAAGNPWLLQNPHTYPNPFLEKLVRGFPHGSRAPAAHWNLAWRAYLNRHPAARNLLAQHIRHYGGTPKTTAALFWSGRLSDEARQTEAARQAYERVLRQYPNHYYAHRARELLGDAASAVPSSPIPPSAEVARRIRRARLLQSIGLERLSERELTTAATSAADSFWVGLELAERAAANERAHEAVRYLKRYAPGYLNRPAEAYNRRFWELLFPLPWQRELRREADRNGLDVHLVAALIRQESEFNAAARSRADARGLMQILPSTGAQLAREAGLTPFTRQQLYNPGTSIQLGTLYLSKLLASFSGSAEAALAGYNAGPSRARQWLAQIPHRDPLEFVESIPFTETREYVFSVIRNAEIYRRLYGAESGAASD